MVKREEIIKFIFDYFGEDFVKKAKAKDDYINGIQIKGKDEVKKLALGVSTNLEFLTKSKVWGADFIIAHHGISLSKIDHYLNPILKKRFKILFDGEITLLAFHYMLDAHKEIGNNAQIIKKLGGKVIEPFYDEWGWIGELKKAEEIDKVITQLSKIFNHKPVKYLYGSKMVRKIAVTSGGGTLRLNEMSEFLEKDFDLYVTGEVKESTPAIIKEAGLNYLVFGHYDTEKFGVMALGELIQKRFPKLEVKFIDVPNPL